jgi:hypothetical protein
MVKFMTLVGIAGFVFASVITIYYWMDRLTGAPSLFAEAFTNPGLSQSDLNRIQAAIQTAPTDDDAIAAHQTLLRYISNDFNKGIKFVIDFGERFYGPNLPLRSDLDTRKLMDTYRNPLQRQ